MKSLVLTTPEKVDLLDANFVALLYHCPLLLHMNIFKYFLG